MGVEEVNRVKTIFSDNETPVTYLEHQEAITSADAVAHRGFELRQGVKAILLTNESDWVLVNVPADKKVDMKAVAELLKWSKSKIRMATEDEVMQKTGCQIGAVPPFGHKETIRILVDEEVLDNEISTFNIGLRTISVKLKTLDLEEVFEKIGVTFGKFVKN
ncbi:YbaK/EbsC family protein [Candidatus Pacearchaeota archaeon]|nr:YbaK/EbsC family protein [Candidatus Pacearchaeota archaeon]